MTNRKIRLQPIQGKFLQTRVNNHDINIWLVDPKTNQQGTEVDYDDAIAILAFRHPVATVAQIKGKDGKYINQLTDDDKAAIQELKNHPTAEPIGSAKSEDNSTLTELVKTQGELLKSQAELMKSMKAEIDDLKKNSKKADKKADKKAE